MSQRKQCTTLPTGLCMGLAQNFQPSQIEQSWYQRWEDSGYFSPNQSTKAPPFCIQLPPPNITGTLHMGHAFSQTIMDTLTRYHRMLGHNALWLPGADHAGIATQIVVERQLAEQGISKTELGREAFIKKLWAWKNISGNTIMRQMRRMGCSVDWSQAYFTMDPGYASKVLAVFVQLYEEGLIYRGKRLVNWDPVLGTAISDIEVENVEEIGQLWHIRYPVVNHPDQAVIVATTRPETMLGDVAVAVHPDDKRYQSLIGQSLQLPLTDRAIPVVADTYVDTSFGTGCLKITPAHDFNDYEIGRHHKMDLVNILTLDGKLRSNAEVIDHLHQTKPAYPLPKSYIGLTCEAARKKIVEDLEQRGYLVETKAHPMKVPRGDRTGAVIEPMLTNQWFVAVNKVAKNDPSQASLAQKAIQAVESGQVRFVPENWVNTYNQWMYNIQDWCISRQLWWGHRIPTWYDETGHFYVACDEDAAYAQHAKRLGLVDETTKQPLSKAALIQQKHHLRQDEDVLDTWFSSALLPFITLGWPKYIPKLEPFLPSSVLVTGYEILSFWVARMIMMTTHFTQKVPFRTVYIHGMVRDHDGKKMSKSEGNVIDPVDLLDGITLDALLAKRTVGLRRPDTAPKIVLATKQLFPEGISDYGADALRFAMASYANLGRQVNFDFNRCRGYRNFCNKLWHATRFVLMHTENQNNLPISPSTQPLHWVNAWITSRLQSTTTEVTEAMNAYRLDLAAQALYTFIWDEYCSWYLELAKVLLAKEDETQRQVTRYILLSTLETLLRLAHPIMPFITEELWQHVAPRAATHTTPFVMVAAWPVAQPHLINQPALAKFDVLKTIVEAVRHLRGEMKIDPATKVPLILEKHPLADALVPFIQALARLSSIALVEKIPMQSEAPYLFVNGIHVMLDVAVDQKIESAKLIKAIDKLDKEIAVLATKLAVLEKAATPPASLIEATHKKQVLCQQEKAAISLQLERIQAHKA